MNYFRGIFLSFFILALGLTSFGVSKTQALTISPVRLELRGDPGQVINEKMILVNEEETGTTFYSSFANFEAQGETGSPSFVEPKDDLGTWINSDSSIYIAPGESKTIPITIRIPTNAEPGGHFAALFWGTSPNGQGGQVSVGARTGILILLTVSGDVSENGGVIEFATKENKRFYTSLPVPFFYRFQNSGDDRIKPEGDIKIRHILGWVSSRVPANQVEGNILPNSTRRFDVNWKTKNGASEVRDGKMGFFEAVGYEWKNFGFGYYRANLKLEYGEEMLTSKDSYGFFVIPWQLLIVMIIVAFLLWYGIGKALRRYNAIVIAKARISLQKEMDKDVVG